MLLKDLREQVLDANLELVRRGLVLYTFGNVSGISRADELIAIKPSGVPYETMTAADIVVTDLEGKVVESTLRPSSDLPTHVELYKRFSNIGGVAHTHSEFATAWAQACRPIPCFGTTHADYFYGSIPVTAKLTPAKLQRRMRRTLGSRFAIASMSWVLTVFPEFWLPGMLHFVGGESAGDAAHNAVILESVARMAYYTIGINADASPIAKELHDKHYLRKHGAKAYYGQPNKSK